MKFKSLSKLKELLEVPSELTDSLPKITILSNGEFTVINHRGIIEYSGEIIRINSKRQIIKITGNNLFVKEITSDELKVTGEIKEIQFLS